jgi:membrane associated rhomboid family serine protease
MKIIADDWSARFERRAMQQLLNTQHAARLKRALYGHILILSVFVGIMWVVEIIDLALFAGNLDWLGIQPRTLVGLRNILFSPFLHVGPGHLLANTLPFIILGWLVMVRRATDFAIVGATAALVSGLGVWILGSANSVHVGMSGVIFGFLGYLLARGYFERSIPSIALAVAAVFLYGGMIFGILPLQRDISWLGHLFGLIGGMGAAYALADRTNQGMRLNLEQVRNTRFFNE